MMLEGNSGVSYSLSLDVGLKLPRIEGFLFGVRVFPVSKYEKGENCSSVTFLFFITRNVLSVSSN